MNKFNILYFLIFLMVSCTVYHPVTERKAVNTPVGLEASAEDTAITNLVKPYSDRLEKDMLRIIAISDVELIKDRPESPMTNFMADLLLEEGQNYCKTKNISLPEVAYVNYGGIRSTLPKGEINVQKIFELMPFENEMVILKVKGDKLYEMAKMIAAREGDGVAGIRIGIKNRTLSTFQVNGKEFDRNNSYWIVTNEYVATGGDNMSMFLEPEEFVASGITIRDLIIKNLENKTKAGIHIMAKKDGRIFYE